MDGGILNHLNATAAPPSDALVILSCLPIGSPGDAIDRTRSAATIGANAEVARLRETTRLVAVEPDFSDLDAPVQMLDPQIAGRALHIGKRQAAREAPTIQAAWGP
jgi:NTE family protein